MGTIGVAAATSFYPTKNLGALGDGGAILTRDAQLAARVKRLRNGGQTSRYHHEEPGANSRLDELQAAILRARLPFLRKWTERRRSIALHYRRALGGSAITVPDELDAGHVYHLFPVLSERREAFQAHLNAHGVETLIHYPVPIPRQPALAGADPADVRTIDEPVPDYLADLERGVSGRRLGVAPDYFAGPTLSPEVGLLFEAAIDECATNEPGETDADSVDVSNVQVSGGGATEGIAGTFSRTFFTI